jgi:subtilase family serine protease
MFRSLLSRIGQSSARSSRRRRRPCKTTGRRTARIEPLETRDLLSLAPLGFAVPDHMAYLAAGATAPMATAGPTGYTPAQIRHAYGFDKIAFNGGTIAGDGSGTTIAIVDAYDDPNIANDLHQFDLRFGLPDPAFTKVNQSGGTAYPAANAGWATEIALDVEWAHAVAPKANILLVEAASNSMANLMAAVDYARRAAGVVAVSMSWGGGEFAGETAYDSYFTTPTGHSGVTFLASSGDSGAPAGYPAVSPNVVAVGGTTLYVSSQGTYLSESGWSGSGGGISSYESQPAYQHGVVTQTTTRRANPDVAYDSSPSTGFPVYDSYNNPASAPWGEWGGTSAAAPQWAGLIAIADQGLSLAGKAALNGATQTLPMLYAMSASAFHDVTAGTSTGRPRYSAGPGYDLVTGRGSPHADLVVSALVGNTSQPPTQGTTHLSVALPSSSTAGAPFSVTVSILDSSNNLTPSYRGTVHFVSSDGAGQVVLPANYTFTAADAGVHTFTGVTLVTAGSQTVTVTDTVNASITGSAALTINPALASPVVVESFEGSRSYSVVGAFYPSASISTLARHDGTYGLLDRPGNDWIYRNDAAVQVKAGDTISVWLEFPTVADGRAYFGFGAGPGGTLSLVAAPNSGQLLLQNNAGYGYVDLASASQTYLPNHWYRLEVDWGTSGAILGKLFDSNGTTLLQSVQATTTAITSGGIAFRAIGSFNKYWDTVQVTAGVNSFTAPAAAGIAASSAAAARRADLAMLASDWSAMALGQSPQAMTSASAGWVDPAGTDWWWAGSARARRTGGLLDDLSALAADEFFRRS